MKFKDLPEAVVRLNPCVINLLGGLPKEARCDEWVVSNQHGHSELRHISGRQVLTVDPDCEAEFHPQLLGHFTDRVQGILSLGLQLTLEDHETVSAVPIQNL